MPKELTGAVAESYVGAKYEKTKIATINPVLNT